MNEKTKKLLVKLHALAERGIGGEKENAQRMLATLCRNFGVENIDDFFNQDVKARIKVVSGKFEKRLFHQVCRKMGFKTGYMNIHKVCSKTNAKIGTRKTNQLYAECTEFEFEELLHEFDFWKKEWKEEQEMFFKAFISKNNIFPSDTKAKNQNDDYELTEEDLMVMQKMNALDKKNYRKPAKQLNR